MSQRDPIERCGFTLVEVLCVIAVIMILVGLLSVVVGMSRRKALSTDEISQMHQIGIAASLYYDDTGHYAMGVDQLHRAGLIGPELCKSPLDPFPDGIANEYCKSLAKVQTRFKALVTDYPRTYLGLADFGHPESNFLSEILPNKGAGWLVSITESKPSPPNTSLIGARPEGRYLRLLMDGSVSTRFHRTKNNAAGEPVWDVTSMYFDEP